MTRQPAILVVAEPPTPTRHLSSTQASLEFARQCAKLLDARVAVLALGENARTLQESGLLAGVAELIVCDSPSPEEHWGAPLAATVADVGREFDLLVAAATASGKELMARAAARLDAAYVADCLGVRRRLDGLEFQRALHGGSILGWCASLASRTVVSVRESRFSRCGERGRGTTRLRSHPFIEPGGATGRMRESARHPIDSTRPDLLEAPVVVSGGQALGPHFEAVLGPLADCFGGALGATRALCDTGHAPACLQVGQTGRIVAPKLYIAVGLSGSMQHVAGMRGSGIIVAINRDPSAPIFELADYGLVADLFQAVPELVKLIRMRTPGHSDAPTKPSGISADGR